MCRNRLSLIAGLVAVLWTGPLAFADCEKKIELTPTGAAVANDISGTAEVRSRDGDTRQRFEVSMDARVPDGTTYSVWANGLLAGTITIDLFGNGELELNNNNDKTLPASVNPVCGIGTVEVQDATGGTVLMGGF